MRMPKPKPGAFSQALVEMIEARLRALRISVHAAEKRYGFPPESLRSVLKGSSPSVDRFKTICDALQIDFTLGTTGGMGVPLRTSLRAKTSANMGAKAGGGFFAANDATISKTGGRRERRTGRMTGGIAERMTGGRLLGKEEDGDRDDSGGRSWHRVGESVDCPIVGIVRAGSEIEHWNDQFPGGESVSVPGALFDDGRTRQWGGVVVRGESMSPIFDDGDILFFDMRYRGDGERLIGRACVVETAAGGAMVKRLERGRRVGMYNLESYNRHHPVVADVVLRTARPVMWVKKG